MDAEVIQCMIQSAMQLGLSESDFKIGLNNREYVEAILLESGIDEPQLDAAFELLDKREKLPPEKLIALAKDVGLDDPRFLSYLTRGMSEPKNMKSVEVQLDSPTAELKVTYRGAGKSSRSPLVLMNILDDSGLFDWCALKTTIVRGLAYYTGTVFEAIADGERAIAGGGRYDNLIELFGGPPTPACGFGMGDVVLSNLLDDKELMPEGLELMEAVARPQASIRPEAFIVPNGDEDNESLVHTLTANLRRGIESEQWSSRENRKPWNADRYAVAPLHARISYKSTRKINKLRDDAMKQQAKFFIVINADDNAELHNLDTHETVGTFSTNPAADNYVGTAIAQRIQL